MVLGPPRNVLLDPARMEAGLWLISLAFDGRCLEAGVARFCCKMKMFKMKRTVQILEGFTWKTRVES